MSQENAPKEDTTVTIVVINVTVKQEKPNGGNSTPNLALGSMAAAQDKETKK